MKSSVFPIGFILFLTMVSAIGCKQSFQPGEPFTLDPDGARIELVYVDGGNFQMGVPEDKSVVATRNAIPAHRVTLSPYYIAKYEVTIEQFARFVEETGYITDAEQAGFAYFFIWSPYWIKRDNLNWRYDALGVLTPPYNYNHPVLYVSHNDANAFCEWLCRRTGLYVTLPTEAQWEYAARGGIKGKGYSHPGSNDVDEVCWYTATSFKIGTFAVGLKKPNELGIYDMGGNVQEWCSDFYATYSSISSKNPTGPLLGNEHVTRGGAWGHNYTYTLCEFRWHYPSTNADCSTGFRVAVQLP